MYNNNNNNGCDKFFCVFFSGENPVKTSIYKITKRNNEKKTKKKSVNFPRDWLVTRFFYGISLR